MFSFTIQMAIGLASLARLVATSPLSTANTYLDAFKRAAATPCSPGGLPILYKDYYNQPKGLCGPPKVDLGLDDNGNVICPGNFQNHCYTYCENYQYFQYDTEVPVLANPYCHGPMTCTVTDIQAVTWTYTGTFNAGLGSDLAKVIAAGISIGVSYASAKTQMVAKAVPLNATTCGYMTFLPELHYSWYA